MFAKLRKKLEDENQVDLSNAGPSNLQRSESKQLLFSRCKDGEEKEMDSPTGQYSAAEHLMKTRSQDDLPSLQSRTDRIQRLETRLKEYASELSSCIEKRKELEEKLATQDVELKNQELVVENKWKSKFGILEAENGTLREKVRLAEAFKNRYVENQEAIDELEGLQTQEMAKIKHMLLNCQQDLQQTNEKLSPTESELTSTKRELAAVEAKRNDLEKELSKVNGEWFSLKEQESNNRQIIEEIGGVKNTLVLEIDSLKTELLQLSNRAKQAEQMVNGLQDENAAVRHTHEMYCKQSILVIEEKDSDLEHLRERVTLLEQRAANCNLDDDSRLQAIIAERNVFEKKVEESRQQLNEIKSTWSDKIMNLERQISHLNEKISEDNEEHARSLKENEEVRRALEEKLKAAEESADRLNYKCQDAMSSLTAKNNEFQARLEEHVADEEKSKESHSASIKDLNEKIKRFELEKISAENEKQSLLSKVHDLEAVVVGKTERENLLETAKTELRSKLENLETVLAAEKNNVEDATKRLASNEALVSELKQKVSALQHSEADKISRIESLEQLRAKNERELTQKNQENEQRLREHREVDQQLAELRKSSSDEIGDLRTTVAQFEASLKTFQDESSELQQQKEQFESMRKRNEDISDQMAALNESVSKQENDIMDKNKTIRLQQQRILDMKKTLQKELKVHALPFDGSNGDSTTTTTSTFEQDVAGVGHNAQNIDIMQRLQTYDPRDLSDDINFRYLKHVVLKFMTSREYEAQHLIRAVSVLLRFTPDEERLIKDTLDWKMSWFRSKPEYGKGQMSKTIPIT